MGRRRIALGALLLALVGASALYVFAGLQVYARYKATYRNYTLSCNGLLAWSPPSVLYIGLYVNQPSLVTINVRSSDPSLAKVTVSIPGFTVPQAIEVQSDSTFQALTFKPSLLSRAALDSFVGKGKQDAEIMVSAQIRGHAMCQTSARLTLYSRQWMRWRDPVTGADLTPYIAGWVTPQVPAIGALVGKASQRLQDHPDLYDNLPALFGYDQGHATEEQVRNEVDALFDTLQANYHLHYSSDNAPFTGGFSQIVQAPGDILASANPTGMCVETSVILASAIERLGMRPYIVFTSSHAYLGVALGDDAGAQISYWETSDLNGGALGSQANVDGDAEYGSDFSTHAVAAVVDIAYERSQGFEPIE
jgi:hypothetical protein